MRLGERLVRDGLIGAEQLATALRAQVVYGGRLGTNLIEIGALDLDTLARGLAEQHGIPAALGSHFNEADPALTAMLPAKLAAKHQAIPLRLSSIAGRHLVVAFADAPTRAGLDDLGFVTGARVTPCIAPELRILYWLERLYAVPRDNRYLRVEGEGHRPESERRRYVQFTEPLPPRGAGHGGLKKGPRDTIPDLAPFGAAPKASASPLPLAGAAIAARLVNATDREAIGDALVDHARNLPCAHAAVLFIIRDGAAMGWKGFSPGRAAVDTLALPLWAPSVLRLASEGRAPFRGPPPPDGVQIHGRLWKALDLAIPLEVLVAPVVLKDRAVNLLYIHPRPGETISKAIAAEVAALCTAATNAYTRLIRGQKSKRG